MISSVLDYAPRVLWAVDERLCRESQLSALQETSPTSTASRHRLEIFGWPFVIAALAALAVLGVAGIGWLVSDHSFGYFTRDAAAITRQAPYMSMVGVVGLFGWAAGATALVCGGYVASLTGAVSRRNALFVSAAAVVYLLLDDAFQIHDYWLPHYLHLNDSVFELGYVVLTIVAVAKGRSFIASTNVRLLVVAGIFFAISVALDVLIAGESVVFLEDGAKLIGIFVLVAYCLDTAFAESRRALRQPIRG